MGYFFVWVIDLIDLGYDIGIGDSVFMLLIHVIIFGIDCGYGGGIRCTCISH